MGAYCSALPDGKEGRRGTCPTNMIRSGAILLLLLPTSTPLVSDIQHQLAVAIDNCLPQSLFELLLPDCLKADKWASESLLPYGKRKTFWLGEKQLNSPKTNIESAIHLLKGHVAKRMTNNKKIIGAEWWVQHRKISDGIMFHFDKDEGAATINGTMKHPIFSTVTYITGHGAPTLIFNQTTPDGNNLIPIIPHEGFLSYPIENRHLIFRGNLQHGALESALPRGNKNSFTSNTMSRVTLLVNWWTTVPAEPNTVPFTSAMARQLSLAASTPTDQEPADLSSAEASVSVSGAAGADSVLLIDSGSGSHPWRPITVPPTAMTVPSNSAAQNYKIVFPPNDYHYFTLPRHIKKGFYSVVWGADQVQGGISRLDLGDQPQVNHLFKLTQPKCILLHHDHDVASVRAWERMVLPLAKSYLHRIKVYMCAESQCVDVINVFGLTHDDLPVVVIDDTLRGKKFIMPSRHHGFEVEGLETFWKSAL